MTPREIALSICEPWFNGDPCEGCKCHKVCTKLVERIEAAIQAERDAETNFGNMAQAVDSTKAEHIADTNKMVAPVAYVTGFSKGYAVVQPVDRSLLMSVGMALYRSLPKREPLTDEEMWDVIGSLADTRFAGPLEKLIRATERAHGIGGEE